MDEKETFFMAMSDIGVLLGKWVLSGVNHYTKDPVGVQEAALKKIIDENKDTEYGRKYDFASIKSIKDFQDKVPLSTYRDYDAYVDRMIAGEKNILCSRECKRYCSSSGSVGKPKVIPKSGKDLWNMQCMGFAATVGTVSKYLKAHGKKMYAQKGPLVMSLTGHPLSDGKMCNGAAQIPLTYLKPITKFFSTSPLSLLYCENEEKIDVPYLQLRFALEERNVSYIGSLVITLVTTMFDYLEENWEMLCDDIEKGIINPNIKITPELKAEYSKKFKPNPARAAELRKEFEKGFDTPIAPRIWPKLSWAYGMIGSNLAVYVDKVKHYVGDIPLHNMGYAAAEGYIAMPVELNVNDAVLLPRSLFFEFLPVEDEIETDPNMRPLLIQDLEEGKKYEIIVTNFSGLYRYRMEDVVKVTGKYNNTPKIEFLYRLNLSMNVANEKTTTQMVDWAAVETAKAMNNELEGHSFYADYSTKPPRYCMLFEPKNPVSEEERLKYVELLDENLRKANEKYFKYRRWGMLSMPEAYVLKHNTYNDYREMLRSRGVVLNQIKPVTVINTKEREDFFFSHIEKPEKVTR